MLRDSVEINLLSKLKVVYFLVSSPVVQLYPVPPDCHLWLCPGHPRPLRQPQHHPDNQAAAVAQLVRVSVIVKQEDDAPVPGAL